MKKQYINPSMEVVKIEARKLLAGSDIPGGGSTNQNLGRRGRFYDDEFEE